MSASLTHLGVLLAGLLLAGCTGANGPTIAAFAPASANTAALSSTEHDAVTVAARQMTGDQAAQVYALKPKPNASEPGVDVCGYVRTAQYGESPLYIEVRTKDGATRAKRGQIGATPANLAKVRFMCRGHGGW